jgi:hypothetical protein
MKFRVTCLAALAALLAACTGSHGGGRAPTQSGSRSPTALATAHLSGYCARLAAAAQDINAAQSRLYTSGGAASLKALQDELRSLRADAPPTVRSALTELASGFETAHRALAHGRAADRSMAASLQPKLAEDARVVSHYVVNTCPAS